MTHWCYALLPAFIAALVSLSVLILFLIYVMRLIFRYTEGKELIMEIGIAF